jgi:hypothetical protein
MSSCFSGLPPGALYNIIPTAGQHTQLQADYGEYKSAVRPTTNVNAAGNPCNPNITNSVGANASALRFQTNFLIPNACPGTIINPTGLPIPLSVLQGTTAGFVDESFKKGLGPLVLNLGTLK